MGRRHAITELNDEQFNFVIGALLEGLTDREVCAAFEREYGDALAKSSLHRWRKAAGDELIERFRLARFQARQIRESVGADESQSYEIILKDLEDQLLASTRKFTAENPLKLLFARQEEENLKIKREKLELDKQKLEFEREKLRGAAIDRVKLGTELLGDLFDFLGADPDGLLFIRKHAKPFNEYLKVKYATAEN